MSPWTSLLESLHSALIDELIERHPDPKPELGMPIRMSEFRLPPSELKSSLVCRVSIGDQSGAAALALSEQASRSLGIGVEQLWNQVLARSAVEFERRAIRPVFQAAPVSGFSLPAGLPSPGRVIWIPVSLSGGQLFLGVAV